MGANELLNQFLFPQVDTEVHQDMAEVVKAMEKTEAMFAGMNFGQQAGEAAVGVGSVPQAHLRGGSMRRGGLLLITILLLLAAFWAGIQRKGERSNCRIDLPTPPNRSTSRSSAATTRS